MLCASKIAISAHLKKSQVSKNDFPFCIQPFLLILMWVGLGLAKGGSPIRGGGNPPPAIKRKCKNKYSAYPENVFG